MAKYEKRYNEVCCLGFYFKNDKIFVMFLDNIEKEYDKKEINYYHTFKRILARIVKYKAGVPVSYACRQKCKEKQSALLAPDAKRINVKYKLLWNENCTKPHMICKIEIADIDTLKRWSNTRY